MKAEPVGFLALNWIDVVDLAGYQIPGKESYVVTVCL